ncbi:MAG: dTDP-4-dehydrorhamnose 3,5-epimerase [Acidobacteriota bacterium]
MRFVETRIAGLYVVELEKIEDDRGFFGRSFCEQEFAKEGLATRMVQANIGFNKRKATLRGLHYQASPFAEAKLVRCTRGRVFDVALDLRPHSRTRGGWYGVELAEETHLALYLPEGFAHGYQTLTDNAEILYLTSQFFQPDAVRGVRFNDLLFNIVWPLEPQVISDKDRSWPDFKWS